MIIVIQQNLFTLSFIGHTSGYTTIDVFWRWPTTQCNRESTRSVPGVGWVFGDATGKQAYLIQRDLKNA